jgi:hypothetical protein
MKTSNKTRPEKRRGRPQKPLEVEIEFIDDVTASDRWDNIFELLRKQASNTDKSNFGPAATQSEQLRLF